MDRPPHDYGGPNMPQQQQQQYGFHPQQQFPPPPIHGGPPPYLPSHPSTLQQFPYPRPIPQQPQMYQNLPPHPHMLQQPPSFPPHPVPSPYHNPYEATPPPPTPPPSDPELQKRIDKLVEYAVKNGPEFEAVVRERERDNPAYGFLFGGEGHGYYRYKLWMSTRPPMGGGGPFNSGFPPLIHPPNPMMSPDPSAVVLPPIVGSSHMQQQPQFPPFYNQQLPHPGQPVVGHSYGRPEFDHSPRPLSFGGVPRPLPSDVEMELSGVLNSLTGTKESIKGAKAWFMQRSTLIPALAVALRDRMFATENPERQMHIIYLANDILFDSLQRRVNPHELDSEALAFKPVLGSMLGRVYHNPHHREDNQSRIKKIVQFWASKKVYDEDTISSLENEMMNALPPATRTDASPLSGDPSSGLPKMGTQSSSQWPPENQGSISNIPNQMVQNTHITPLPTPQFHQAPIPSSGFIGSVPIPSNLQQVPTTSKISEKPPPYPLFPPGLIPGMVRKMQIGSGVPYSPLSPLDIPTTIPPSNISQTEILDRVSKFFRDIGEVNPCEGPMKGSSSASRDDYEDYEYEKEPQVRKGGACIPPPPSLNVDPVTGTFPDGSMERKPGTGSGSGRLGLGATADPNEPSQYDDVYSSYRKQRSTNYHSSISSRSAAT